MLRDNETLLDVKQLQEFVLQMYKFIFQQRSTMCKDKCRSLSCKPLRTWAIAWAYSAQCKLDMHNKQHSIFFESLAESESCGLGAVGKST